MLVDQNTGTVTLRARFANPQSILLPGMFVTAAVRAGDRHVGIPGAAAGGHARSAGQCDLVRRRAGQPRGAADRRRRPDAGPLLGRYAGPRAGREGDHPRHGQPARRRADQAGPGKRAAEGQGAAARRNEGDAEASAAAKRMSRIFIERPIFAWVLAIIIMLGGIGAIFALPGRAISRRRADPDQRSRDLSRARRPRRSRAASRRSSRKR